MNIVETAPECIIMAAEEEGFVDWLPLRIASGAGGGGQNVVIDAPAKVR